MLPSAIKSWFNQINFIKNILTIFCVPQFPSYRIKIDPEAVSKDDVEMLQDLILAAMNDAHRKADEQMSQQMSGMMGGLKIPGMF